MMILLVIIVFGGYLLPLPCAVMAWREWRILKISGTKSEWRRAASTATLCLFTLAITLWAYAVFHELRNDYSYVYFSAQIGRWSSLALIVIAGFAEGKCRVYLLIGAAGLLFFYGASIGELP